LREPTGLVAVMFVLIGLSVVIGLYPQPLLSVVDDVVRGLTFVKVSS
jgi:hypothetical protein